MSAFVHPCSFFACSCGCSLTPHFRSQTRMTIAGEAEASRARILEFLQRHTAYELIPESSKARDRSSRHAPPPPRRRRRPSPSHRGWPLSPRSATHLPALPLSPFDFRPQVVVLDTAIPVRQAFHALYEQGVHTAPLWDEDGQAFVGMISPGDFIALLCRLQSVAGAPPTLSELELDSLTIDAWMRETVTENRGAQAAPISVCPEDSLLAVSHALLRSGSAALPMLSTGTASSDRKGPDTKAPAASQLLHLATMPGVLECLMRHFRGVPNALPLLSQPVGALPIGTWVSGLRKDTQLLGDKEPPRPLVTMSPSTPLKNALAMLLQAGVGGLPIVDDNNVLLDVYGAHAVAPFAPPFPASRWSIVICAATASSPVISFPLNLDPLPALSVPFCSAQRHPVARPRQRL